MVNNQLTDWQEEIANQRLQMISELLNPTLDRAKKKQIVQKIAHDYNLSVRTIQRYESAFREKGFSGLKPADRHNSASSRLPDNFSVILNDAVALKKEVPSRSVNQIIYILEAEEKVPPGVIKRSTLQRHLFNEGFGETHLKKYKEDEQSRHGRRFCKDHRMMLVQADIKYGVGIIYGKGKQRKTVYLSSIIDDHSRYILHSEWYESQDEDAVIDVFEKAVLKHGKFDKAYTDNGTQYISKHLIISCAKIGITLRRARIRSGKSKGKIERFHQTVDQFIAEIKLRKPTTLAEINEAWNAFLDEYYHKRPHQGIREYYEAQGRIVSSEGITPEQEWNRDTRQLVYLDKDVVGAAFRKHETRKVDRGACISFKGRKYEVKSELIGCIVEIEYDHKLDTELTIRYKDMTPFIAKPVKIGPYCAQDMAIPQSLQKEPVQSSRLLDAIEKKNKQSKQTIADAISFESLGKE